MQAARRPRAPARPRTAHWRRWSAAVPDPAVPTAPGAPPAVSSSSPETSAEWASLLPPGQAGTARSPIVRRTEIASSRHWAQARLAQHQAELDRQHKQNLTRVAPGYEPAQILVPSAPPPPPPTSESKSLPRRHTQRSATAPSLGLPPTAVDYPDALQCPQGPLPRRTLFQQHPHALGNSHTLRGCSPTHAPRHVPRHTPRYTHAHPHSPSPLQSASPPLSLSGGSAISPAQVHPTPVPAAPTVGALLPSHWVSDARNVDAAAAASFSPHRSLSLPHSSAASYVPLKRMGLSGPATNEGTRRRPLGPRFPRQRSPEASISQADVSSLSSSSSGLASDWSTDSDSNSDSGPHQPESADFAPPRQRREPAQSLPQALSTPDVAGDEYRCAFTFAAKKAGLHALSSSEEAESESKCPQASAPAGAPSTKCLPSSYAPAAVNSSPLSSSWSASSDKTSAKVEATEKVS